VEHANVGTTQLRSDAKAFATVILAHWDLLRKWNAPVLPPLGSLSLPFIQLDMHSFYRVRTVMENLKKSWNFKMVISRSGKVMEKT